MTFEIGDIVEFAKSRPRTYSLGYYVYATLRVGDIGEIVKVNSSNYHVKIITSSSSNGVGNTFSVPRTSYGGCPSLKRTDEDVEIPRALGEVPEGMISPDDPRLAWLWEDAGKYAKQVSHCTEYDNICNALGIPGRERSFKVTRNLNGFSVTKNFKARSRKIAEEMFDAELAQVSLS